jgi:hypothetical protein
MTTGVDGDEARTAGCALVPASQALNASARSRVAAGRTWGEWSAMDILVVVRKVMLRRIKALAWKPRNRERVPADGRETGAAQRFVDKPIGRPL